MIVGIPHYNDAEGLKECIKTLLESTESVGKIIVISSPEDCILHFPDEARIELITTPKLGPLDAYNRLFEIAKERKEDLFLTQTDVTFYRKHKADWLQQMKDISAIEDCGIVTCFAGGGISGPDFIEDFPWVGAWCTYIPYKTIEKIGGYDIKIPLGYGVDIDYSYAIKQAGFKTYVCNYWVDHHPNYIDNHESEKVNNIGELKEEAFAYMRKKWKIGEFRPNNFGGGIEGI